jgi:subtilisin family serine protease
MKTPNLLLSLPLLLTALAAEALPPESASTPAQTIPRKAAGTEQGTGPAPVSGITTRTGKQAPLLPATAAAPVAVTGELRKVYVRGRHRELEIMTDQYQIRHRDGGETVMNVPRKGKLEEIAGEAIRTEQLTGDRADLVAYAPGRPKIDANKMLITKRVSVRLAKGVTPSVFAKNTGAVRAQRLSFMNDALILTYGSALEAMDAVKRLQSAPGVLHAENVVAVKRPGDNIPNSVQYFSHPSGPEYQPLTWTDVVVHWDFALIINTSAYQWWANNEVNPASVQWLGTPAGPGILAGPWAAPPALIYLGDMLPLEYNPLTPKVHGEQTDLRLPIAWENIGDFNKPVSGRGRKVLIIDDGVQKSHGDLRLAVDLNPNNHYNFFNDTKSGEPLDPANDTHGTSLAGFVGGRILTVGSRIAGVAPGCLIQSAVAQKGFVDDIDWAQAFALGSTLTDSDRDNDFLDEDRSGVVFFEIVLNASSGSGSQDAVDLYPEDWLWRRAIRFGSTRARQLSGAIYVTSAGNGAIGHMNTNYVEQKNCIYQIPVASISDMGRQIAWSNKGCNIVCCAPSGTDELPPIMNWPSAPPGNQPGGWGPVGTPAPSPPTPDDPPPPPPPSALPIRVSAPVEAEDIPYFFRRISQGVPTIRTNNAIDFNFTGTSASAAQVAGIAALMLEKNPNLSARDVKEIMLRSCRICNDVRTTYDDLVAPTLWRMSRMGVPMHYAYGAGLIDANKAVKIADRWQNLPANPMPSRTIDLETLDVDDITQRNTETGGIYIPIPTRQLIPVDGRSIEIPLPPPPTGIRLEHVEVRVRLYHKRRGDLEITLIAPPELGWEEGRMMQSELFVPHREDYNESPWHPTEEALRDATDWTFTSVRHWGTVVSSGLWRLRIRDAVSRGTTTTATYADPVIVPVANPTDVQSQQIDGVGITYHGTFGESNANNPPVVDTERVRMFPGTTIQKAQLTVEDLAEDSEGIRFPVTNWDFFHTSDIVPPHPTTTAHEPFEYFPPAFRNPLNANADPADLLPIEAFDLVWPVPPFTALNPPLWISFDFPNPNALVPPEEGPSGGMTSWPLWGPNGARMERSTDGVFMIVRDTRNSNNDTNFIHVRLNRKLGQLEVKPFNPGRFTVNVFAENLLGKSRPKAVDITVVPDDTATSWVDLWWDPPFDPNVICWECDPDGDDLANGLEYLMRLNPTVFDSSGIPGHRIENGEMVFTWSQEANVSDGELHAQVSEDLVLWADVTPTVLSEVNGMQNMEWRVPTADQRLYFRLWAEWTGGGPPP